MTNFDLLSFNAMISLINLFNKIKEVYLDYKSFFIFQKTIQNKKIVNDFDKSDLLNIYTNIIYHIETSLHISSLHISLLYKYNTFDNDLNNKQQLLQILLEDEELKDEKIKKINDFFIKHPFLDWDTFLRNSPNVISELFLLFDKYEFCIVIPHILKEYYKLIMRCDFNELKDWSGYTEVSDIFKDNYDIIEAKPILFKIYDNITELSKLDTNISYTGIINNLNKVIAMNKKHFEI